MVKIIKDKFVLVLWNDSKVLHGWTVDDCNEADIAHCRTVGILKAENKGRVVVALGDSNESVLETIAIPKGCITKIHELRVK